MFENEGKPVQTRPPGRGGGGAVWCSKAYGGQAEGARGARCLMEGSIACRWDREGSCVYFWASAGKVLGLKKECDRKGNR